MPLIVQEAAEPRCPRDFSLQFPQNDPRAPIEQRCLERVNEFVNYLAGIDADETPRGQELEKLRDEYVELLHARADEVVAGTYAAEELLYTAYEYQGQFDIKVQRLVNATFFVSIVPRDGDERRLVNFDIGEGETTPEEADLMRSIKTTETVIDIVLKRPRLSAVMRRRYAWWRARHTYYVGQLVDIGRIGLTERNQQLAKVNLASLQENFVAQQAEAVKNRYVRRLGLWAVFWILLNAISYILICRYLAPSPRVAAVDASYGFLADIAWRFRNFFLLAIGAALGAWLAFLFQRPTLRFADLVQLDENLLRPFMRVIFTIVLGTVVGLLFWTGMLLISIGEFSTNFHNAGTPAMVIGAFCGIASAAIAAALSNRAMEFARSVGGQDEKMPISPA